MKEHIYLYSCLAWSNSSRQSCENKAILSQKVQRQPGLGDEQMEGKVEVKSTLKTTACNGTVFVWFGNK
jgi:hypothetical protein